MSLLNNCVYALRMYIGYVVINIVIFIYWRFMCSGLRYWALHGCRSVSPRYMIAMY